MNIEQPAKPMEIATFWSVRTSKLQNRLTKNLVWVIKSAITPHMPKCKTIVPLVLIFTNVLDSTKHRHYNTYHVPYYILLYMHRYFLRNKKRLFLFLLRTSVFAINMNKLTKQPQHHQTIIASKYFKHFT